MRVAFAVCKETEDLNTRQPRSLGGADLALCPGSVFSTFPVSAGSGLPPVHLWLLPCRGPRASPRVALSCGL